MQRKALSGHDYVTFVSRALNPNLIFLSVERNVVYDVKGLSFFIEDGMEENNIVQYNLAIYTRQSLSLLNADVTPASFWITNP